MIKTTIYGLALSTIILNSGATAIQVTNPTFAVKRLYVSSDTFKIAASRIDTAALEQSVFNQINNYRASQGLPAS